MSLAELKGEDLAEYERLADKYRGAVFSNQVRPLYLHPCKHVQMLTRAHTFARAKRMQAYFHRDTYSQLHTNTSTQAQAHTALDTNA